MNNAEWMIKTGHKFIELDAKYIDQEHGCRITINGKTVEKNLFVNRDNAILYWLDMEHVEPILDDAEKRYLSAVIKPFRDRVKYIEKVCADHLYDEPDYYIDIKFNDGSYDMNFPSFDEKYMYKGLEINRTYTLEELGL